MDDKKLQEIRSYKIVKSNEIIQKARYNLQLQEQKIILYLISKIKAEDMELKEQLFQIRDFCLVCGLDDDNGANYKYIKETLKNLRDKSIWVTLPNGSETTLAWIDQVTINPNSGAVMLKINDLMKPYLIQLKERFTQYELLYTLAMKSQYSIHLYELLKSYEYQRDKTFEIEELKRLLFATGYTRYPDFIRFVVERATDEINRLSDLTVIWTPIKDGKRYAQINFTMKLKKNLDEKLLTWANIDEVISPEKISLYEKLNKTKPKTKNPKGRSKKSK